MPYFSGIEALPFFFFSVGAPLSFTLRLHEKKVKSLPLFPSDAGFFLPIGPEPRIEKSLQFLKEPLPCRKVIMTQHIFEKWNDLSQLLFGKVRSCLHLKGLFQGF